MLRRRVLRRLLRLRFAPCGLSLGNCCLGDPWTLQGYVDPCGCCPISFGGWTQIGFHTDQARLSTVNNDGLSFNDHAGRLNLHQQWLWAEKVAEAPCCGVDWGFRCRHHVRHRRPAAPRPSATRTGSWDFANGWDRNGGYGWAMPQLYGEVAWGDWSVIAGHFYTLVGYEVVTAPDNFFYSHALTMFNSEPFTHTGVLATYSGFDNVEFYGWLDPRLGHRLRQHGPGQAARSSAVSAPRSRTT